MYCFVTVSKTCFEGEDQGCIFHINYITEYCKSIINPVFFFIICQELKSRIWSSPQVRKMCASTINYLNLLGYFMLENQQKHSEWCHFYQIILFFQVQVTIHMYICVKNWTGCFFCWTRFLFQHVSPTNKSKLSSNTVNKPRKKLYVK